MAGARRGSPVPGSLSRRALLAGAGAAVALAGCARAPVSLVTPSAAPTGSARARLDQAMAAFSQNTDLLGVAVRDRVSGVDFDFRADYASQSASMAKVMLSVMALRGARAAGGEADFATRTHISRALIDSDNDAADALWDAWGRRPAYDETARALGLPPTTHPDDTRDFWSWTWTTPSDHRLLMHHLVTGTPALVDGDRRYLLDVMGKTNPEQTWGVGNPRSRQVKVQLKNGWVQFQSTDNLWAVNSVGHVEGGGRDYVACFMCRVPSFDEGRALLDAIGASVWDALGAGPLR